MSDSKRLLTHQNSQGSFDMSHIGASQNTRQQSAQPMGLASASAALTRQQTAAQPSVGLASASADLVAQSHAAPSSSSSYNMSSLQGSGQTINSTHTEQNRDLSTKKQIMETAKQTKKMYDHQANLHPQLSRVNDAMGSVGSVLSKVPEPTTETIGTAMSIGANVVRAGTLAYDMSSEMNRQDTTFLMDPHQRSHTSDKPDGSTRMEKVASATKKVATAKNVRRAANFAMGQMPDE